MSHRKANNSASLLNLIPSNLFSDIEQCHSEQVLGGREITIGMPSPQLVNYDPTMGNDSFVMAMATDPTKQSVLIDNTTNQSNSVYQSQSSNSDGVTFIVTKM